MYLFISLIPDFIYICILLFIILGTVPPYFNSLAREAFHLAFSSNYFHKYSHVHRFNSCLFVWKIHHHPDIIIIIIIIIIIRVFHISVSWWFFTGDWVRASLIKSPGLFSVFWPFSIMLFGWSRLGLQLPNLPGPLIII